MDITLNDINALVELATRAPKSAAETLWLQELLKRINQSMKEQQEQRGE